MKNIQLKTAIPGPKSAEILARRAASMPNGLARSTDVVVISAKGAMVEDADGNHLIDFAGGIGVLNAGHRPTTVVNAIKKQLDKVIHSCALVTTNEPTVELCELLNRLTPGDFPKKTLLANSGAESVENAVNIAKYYTKRPAIIVFEGAYHGRTHLTLSMTSKYGLFKKGFGAFTPDIYRLPTPNLTRPYPGMSKEEFLQHCIRQIDHAFIAQVDPSAVAAIVIEPVQGEGGFVPMPKPFLEKIRAVCDQHGILMVADEIQSGMGRTGKLYAIEHSGVVPDMVVTAKSLGAGLPIGAVTARAEIMDALHLGAVGSTYGGNPVACAAAVETLKIISDPAFLKRAEQVGEQMRRTMEAWKKKYPLIGDVRGLGGMRLVEFVKDKKTMEPDPDLTLEILKDAVQQGIVLIRAGLYSNCIRLLPPFVITNGQLKEGLEVLEGAIARAHNKRVGS